MKVKFWGVRGSIPTPGPNTIRYGGNTACIEVRDNNDNIFIFDAGTGIRELGNEILKERKKTEFVVLLSHTHWDHIHGFPFFPPIYIPGNKIDIYGPLTVDKNLKNIVAGQMEFQYFPVKLEHVRAELNFHELKAGHYNIHGVDVQVRYMNHPVPTIGYRLSIEDKVIVYSGDNEPFQNIFEDTGSSGELVDEEDSLMMKEAAEAVLEAQKGIIDFTKDADICIYDAQYTKEEYQTKKGWGHSTVEDAIEIAKEANIKRLVLFHHDPMRTDEQIETILMNSKRKLEQDKSSILLLAAQEGMEIEI